jgi:hypothetical protein
VRRLESDVHTRANERDRCCTTSSNHQRNPQVRWHREQPRSETCCRDVRSTAYVNDSRGTREGRAAPCRGDDVLGGVDSIGIPMWRTVRMPRATQDDSISAEYEGREYGDPRQARHSRTLSSDGCPSRRSGRPRRGAEHRLRLHSRASGPVTAEAAARRAVSTFATTFGIGRRNARLTRNRPTLRTVRAAVPVSGTAAAAPLRSATPAAAGRGAAAARRRSERRLRGHPRR